MISIGLCLLALALSYLVARRSLANGLAVLLTVGYLYGIVRANELDRYSHLLFDAALLGVYAARLFSPVSIDERIRLDELRLWVAVLIAWPVILFLVPRQDWLVELVGLRGNVFMLPCLLLGASLTRRDMYRLACWIAILNVGAGLVAAAQFVFGIEPFFPRNAVTEIIYRSGDIAGFTAHRIPSVFPNAHAYGGTMVLTIPLIIGAWQQPIRHRLLGIVFPVSLTMSAVAIFMTGARLPAIQLFVVLGVAIFSGQVRAAHRFRGLFVVGVVAWMVASAERLQRFLTLQDPELVAERVAGSINLGFFDIAARYPLGNGLGGGGTSIPYFLLDRVRNVVAMENEYARIVLEQGIPGIMAWTLFLGWMFTRKVPAHPSWRLTRRLIWVAGATAFASGLVGTGLLTAIPGTAILLISMGWVVVPERQEAAVEVAAPPVRAAVNW